VIVLDTHALVWWCARPEKLTPAARRAIARASALGVAAITCWEIARLVARRRLRLDRETRVWLEQALARPGVELLPLTPAVGVTAAGLPESITDPADRLIVATTLERRASLVSADGLIEEARVVEVIW
jgi:PIN domain nuclease of toxin-antitoxin system